MAETPGTYDSEVQRTLYLTAENPEELLCHVSACLLKADEWINETCIVDLGKTKKDYHESLTEHLAEQAMTAAGFSFEKKCAESFQFILPSREKGMIYSSSFKVMLHQKKDSKGKVRPNQVSYFCNLTECISFLRQVGEPK
jgi:hypothetical protein